MGPLLFHQNNLIGSKDHKKSWLIISVFHKFNRHCLLKMFRYSELDSNKLAEYFIKRNSRRGYFFGFWVCTMHNAHYIKREGQGGDRKGLEGLIFNRSVLTMFKYLPAALHSMYLGPLFKGGNYSRAETDQGRELLIIWRFWLRKLLAEIW